MVRSAAALFRAPVRRGAMRRERILGAEGGGHEGAGRNVFAHQRVDEFPVPGAGGAGGQAPLPPRPGGPGLRPGRGICPGVLDGRRRMAGRCAAPARRAFDGLGGLWPGGLAPGAADAGGRAAAQRRGGLSHQKRRGRGASAPFVRGPDAHHLFLCKAPGPAGPGGCHAAAGPGGQMGRRARHQGQRKSAAQRF